LPWFDPCLSAHAEGGVFYGYCLPLATVNGAYPEITIEQTGKRRRDVEQGTVKLRKVNVLTTYRKGKNAEIAGKYDTLEVQYWSINKYS
jgi:hypothetical protein